MHVTLDSAAPKLFLYFFGQYFYLSAELTSDCELTPGLLG